MFFLSEKKTVETFWKTAIKNFQSFIERNYEAVILLRKKYLPKWIFYPVKNSLENINQRFSQQIWNENIKL